MENATKALLIVAGVLIGVMILSLGLALYYSLNGFVEDHQATIQENALQKFNTQFLQYVNYNDTTGVCEFKLTVQDIITVANLAHENNTRYNIPESPDASIYNPNNEYVTVNADLYYINQYGGTSLQKLNHLEQTVAENSAEWLSTFVSDHEYQCSRADIKISEITGKIYEINFK